MSSQWSVIAQKATKKLQSFEVDFNQFKNDDSYVKAKAAGARRYWAFAHNAEEIWVELELKPRTQNKKKPVPQDDLYDNIVQNQEKIEVKLGAEISCSLGGNDRRIKSFINNVSGQVKLHEDVCVNRMVAFVMSLQDYLDD